MSKLIHRLWSEDAGTRHRRIRGDVGGYSGSGGGNGSLDRVECQQCIFKRSQFAPVVSDFHRFESPLRLIRIEMKTSMTRFTPGAAFTAYFWFTREQRLRSSLE